jgi:hypothetical protein
LQALRWQVILIRIAKHPKASKSIQKHSKY